MNKTKKIAYLAAALLCLAAGVPAAIAADDAAAIRTTSAAWFNAYNAGNADAVAQYYAEDAVLYPPSVYPLRGRAAIKKFLFKDMADMRGAGISLVPSSGDDVGVNGDTAWHAGSFTVKSKTGEKVDEGAYIEVWRKKDGKWTMLRDIWNSSTPAPEFTSPPEPKK